MLNSNLSMTNNMREMKKGQKKSKIRSNLPALQLGSKMSSDLFNLGFWMCFIGDMHKITKVSFTLPQKKKHTHAERRGQYWYFHSFGQQLQKCEFKTVIFCKLQCQTLVKKTSEVFNKSLERWRRFWNDCKMSIPSLHLR